MKNYNSKLKIEILILALITLLAFILRVYKLDKVPPSLYWDEAAMALDAKSVSLTGKDQHGNFWLEPIYPSWGDYKLPGYILTAVPFFKLIKNNPEIAIRLPSALAGTLTVLVVYFLTKEIFKDILKSSILDFTALGISFLLAISPWHLQFSRAAFEANLALLFNSSSLLFFLKSIKKKFWLILVFIFTVFGIYTYYSARIILPVILFLTFLFFEKKSLKNIAIFISMVSLIFLATFPLRSSILTPQAEQFRLSTKNILSDYKIIESSAQLLEQDGNTLLAKKIHHRFLYKAKVLISHYFDHLSLNFLVLSGDENLRHSTGRIGVLLTIAFIALIYGEYLIFKINKKLFSFLNFSLFFSFLPACIPYEIPHALRSLNAVIFVNIIAGFGLVQLIELIKLKNKTFLFSNSCLQTGMIYFLLLAQFVLYLHDYYIHYPNRSFFSWQGGYKEAMTKVKEEYNKAEKIIFTDIYARPYLYFLLYSNYPIKEFQKNRQNFLINEPLNYLETRKIDKIEFRRVKESDKKLPNVLIIAAQDELIHDSVIKINPAFVLWKNY